MFKILRNNWMLAKLITIVFLFRIFLIGETSAEENGNNFVDYVFIYNQKNQPADYKEEDNAKAYYQQAIKAYLKVPQELIHSEYWRIWPSDLSKQNLQAIRQWVKSNSLALDYFTQASKKAYFFWTEKSPPGDSVLGILLPGLAEIRNLARLTCCRAMLEAMDGYINDSAKDIETVYRVGNHFNGPRQPVEQIVGVSYKIKAIETVLIIIQNTHITRKDRECLYRSLKKYIEDEEFTPDMFVIKLTCLDCLQRMYTLDEDGRIMMDNHLFGKQLGLCRQFFTALTLLDSDLLINQQCTLYNSKLVERDYEKAKKQVTEKLEKLKNLMSLEAWQLNEIMTQKNGILQNIQESHPLLNILGAAAVNLKLSTYEQLRAETIALDTIMGVLTFEENNGRLPVNLYELKDAGLLEKMPIDPFSGKPIVYKKLDDNFTVYSYGLDFDDDGGVRMVNYDSHNGDIVVWPVKKYKEIVPKYK
jgi:hypothetical protein